MAEPIPFQTIFQFLQTVALVVGVYYYIMTIRVNRRNQELTLKAQEQALETRQAQLFMPIYSKFYDRESMEDVTEIIANWEWSDLDDFMEKYGGLKNPKAYGRIVSWLDYFEGIGVLVKRKLIDASLIDDLMSGFVIMFWEKTESFVREYRASRNYPQYAEHFEYLYHEIKSIIEEQHPD
jgi:hypothetical protein